jgi:hypothetical protein
VQRRQFVLRKCAEHERRRRQDEGDERASIDHSWGASMPRVR